MPQWLESTTVLKYSTGYFKRYHSVVERPFFLHWLPASRRVGRASPFICLLDCLLMWSDRIVVSETAKMNRFRFTYKVLETHNSWKIQMKSSSSAKWRYKLRLPSRNSHTTSFAIFVSVLSPDTVNVFHVLVQTVSRLYGQLTTIIMTSSRHF